MSDDDQDTIVHEEEEKSAGEKAKESAEAREKGAEKVREMEESDEAPPSDLSKWPSDEGKYITFGGPEGEAGYDEGATKQLGESEVRHHEDGSVTVSGEEVDDPDEYKGEPIPGGPTDPDSPDVAGENTDSSDDEETSDDEKD